MTSGKRTPIEVLLIINKIHIMSTKEQALYALMDNEGYSPGLILTTLHAVGWSKEALDDLIIFIEDNHPTEENIMSKISDYLQ